MDNEKITELETRIFSAVSSKDKVDALNELAFEIRNTETERSISLCKEAQQLSAEINYSDGTATALTNEAFCSIQITEYELALKKLFEALKIFEENKNEKGVAQVHYNLCLVYFRLSDFNNGLDSNIKALSYYQKVNNKAELVRCYFQIGLLYNALNDNTSAVEYFNQSIELSRETKNRTAEAASIMGLGQVHLNLKDYEKSAMYLKESMAIREEIKDWRGYAAALYAYMTVCVETGKFQEAEEISIRGIKLTTELGEKMGISRFMLAHGKIFLKQNKIPEAEKTILEALQTAEKINLRMALLPAHLSLSEIYQSKGDFEQALKHYQQFHKMKEELQNTNAAIKAKSIQLFSIIENAQKEAEINRLKNVELKSAYEVIEKKNKDITASITYAKRIQTAILPKQRIVEKYLENSFILYKPKDIVAGDFYWMETVDDLVLIAACDCTGHGVPGAMVSVVCHTVLNRVVREFKLTQPAAILDKTAEIITGKFADSEVEIRDGMDISFCTYNTRTKILEWAGANNPLWLIQNGELTEIKPDKQHIGKDENRHPFTNHTFSINTGDSIYLFTDGFADQFGGEPKQKKLTKKRFRELIMSVQNKTMQEQGIALEKFITEYRKEVEQIDDILVMGVKI